MKRMLIGIGGIILVNYFVLAAQSVISCLRWHLFVLPESRYWIQSLMLLLPFVPLLLLKFRYGRHILIVGLGVLVATAAIYTVKAHIPGSRRNRQVAACEWAADYIRNDYRGPKNDSVSSFTVDEYSRTARPVVDALSARVGLLVGGRNGTEMCGLCDVPDYIVDEPLRINCDWFAAAEYEKVAERQFGKRLFQIMKLKKRKLK